MLLFATGWFGADSLVTVLLTDGYGTSVARAAVVLSAAPLAWAATSLLVPRLVRGGAAVSLALAAGVPRPSGLALAYAAFAAVLAAGAVVARRAAGATRPA